VTPPLIPVAERVTQLCLHFTLSLHLQNLKYSFISIQLSELNNFQQLMTMIIPGYYNIRLRITLFCYLFYFSDVIATCFGPLSGHHQAILKQIYYETSFYNGSVVSVGIKILVLYTFLFNLESYVIILFFIIKIGVKIIYIK
jgi:hypothetical protein